MKATDRALPKVAFAMAGLLMSFAPAITSAAEVCADRKLNEVLVAPHRTVEDVARDKYRHPCETLGFLAFGQT